MIEKNLVSVIVPLYCAEKYISHCVESILNQTYTNMEIILVDDGSTDNSVLICENYAKTDSRIKIVQQENKGVSAARNTGISFSHGEYLTFVDSDDEFLENAVEIMVKYVVDQQADIFAGAEIYINRNNEEIPWFVEKEKNMVIFSGKESLELSLDFDRRMLSCHGKLFRRDFIENIRFVEGKNINEDLFFVFQCCLNQPKFIWLNKCIYKYYYRENSLSHGSFSNKYLDMFYFAEKKKELIEKHYPELSDRVCSMEVSTHLFFLNIMCRIKGSEYSNIEKNSIRFVRKNYHMYKTNNVFEKILVKIVYWGLFPVYKVFIKLKFGLYGKKRI